MDVHSEDELAPCDVLQLLDEVPVAIAPRDALILGERERVGAGGGEPHSEREQRAGESPAQLGQLAQRIVDAGADAGGDLGGALGQLRVHAVGELSALELAQQHLDLGDQAVPVGRDEHVLLLDPEGERRPGAEVRLERAALRNRARRAATGAALPARRRGEGFLGSHWLRVSHQP